MPVLSFLKNFKKIKALGQEMMILLFFTCYMALESCWHLDFTSFVFFPKYAKLEALEEKENGEKSYFCSRGFIVGVFF